MTEANVILVTVGVPLFNHEGFVAEAIESFASQTHTRLEIVIIDDGSSDRSAEIAQSTLAPLRNRFERVVFEQQPNRGVVATLNRLVALSRGDVFVPIASDDALAPDAIERRLRALEMHNDALAVFTDCVAVDSNGAQVAASAIEQLHRGDTAALQCRELLPLLIILRWSIPGPVLAIRTEAIRPGGAVGPYDEDVFPEDLNLYLALALGGHLVFEPVPTARYRVHTGSLSSTRSDELRDGTRATLLRHLDAMTPVQRVAARTLIATVPREPGKRRSLAQIVTRLKLAILRRTVTTVARTRVRLKPAGRREMRATK